MGLLWVEGTGRPDPTRCTHQGVPIPAAAAGVRIREGDTSTCRMETKDGAYLLHGEGGGIVGEDHANAALTDEVPQKRRIACVALRLHSHRCAQY